MSAHRLSSSPVVAVLAVLLSACGPAVRAQSAVLSQPPTSAPVPRDPVERPPSATAAAPTAPAASARVNGRTIPVCSHGQLCQGAFLRALTSRP
jgi:hypothetical protein